MSVKTGNRYPQGIIWDGLICTNYASNWEQKVQYN